MHSFCSSFIPHPEAWNLIARQLSLTGLRTFDAAKVGKKGIQTLPAKKKMNLSAVAKE
jgi:hypothetical protein